MGRYLTAGKLSEIGAGAMRVYGFAPDGDYSSQEDKELGMQGIQTAEQFCLLHMCTPSRLGFTGTMKKQFQAEIGPFTGIRPRTLDHIHIMLVEGKAPIIVSHPYVDPEVLEDNEKQKKYVNEFFKLLQAMPRRHHFTNYPSMRAFSTPSWYFPGRTLGLVYLTSSLFNHIKLNTQHLYDGGYSELQEASST
jgi:hypothetical protein